MKLNLTWGDLARAAGGRLIHGDGTDRLDVISTDTRSVKNGEAFWAIVGERVDAHTLLNEELAQKSSGWIVASDKVPTNVQPPHLVVVPDTLKALQALAHYHRNRFDIPISAIVGSNGKTTTKEMLKSICELVGPTCATPGNWNNQIGLPLPLR
jgi:UDP-N-acetylmuramoyl-tripeptide--D-alanyl-D-alanine ligase